MLKDYFESNHDTLELYTQAITKAHGKNHPEVFEVRKIYKSIQDKAQHNNWDLSNAFLELRRLTNQYMIPNDACETMTQTYQMLKHFDTLAQE
ncbi:iron-sulfur cluster repair di-iron protein, ric [Staphylococcus sp. 17KM0847]|uniref:iron-sulfur cluster repair di-iron protein, ric n=1 Tax=Staphylococcus sp. 17KM0847 TaxID=2583989 RepID=UPI0015DBCEEF|nr:iron-sulfur cluster repair di-iron protein, ric [Staphylococcus sp. 17KM0847]QLK86401.1 iron-sulfur cluster repair di-iron protein, ric [Staphylococcus sp. 17KM0847]